MKSSTVEILLVEDDRAEARLAREAFTEAGIDHRLYVAQDGVEAMDFLRHRGRHGAAPRPHLVLLDLNLPRKNGREVLLEMKQDDDLRRIPVIVLTTSIAKEDIDQAYELQANCYIAKPMDMDGFVRVVKSVQGYWLSLAELPGG